MNPKTYVAGFLFDFSLERVALIRKLKPEWQAGLLNGIGGKIEEGETAMDAMVREFKEETGSYVSEWRHYLSMQAAREQGWSVEFFCAIGDLNDLRSIEAEQIEIVALDEIHPLRHDMIENLPWLIPLALDSLMDGRPAFTTCNYPT